MYMTSLWLSAYRQYMVTDADIDSAAYRVLRARMELGLFDSGEQNLIRKYLLL